MPNTDKPKRQTRTPAQRAEETLTTAQKRVTKLEAALKHQRGLVEDYSRQLRDATARRDYLAQDPDLPAEVRHRMTQPEGQPTTTTKETTND